jgi:hypothetical protein
MTYENVDLIENPSDMFVVAFKDDKPVAVLHIEAGSGDNLLPEDREEGYVDYANYDIFKKHIPLDEDEASECDDGGMLMMKEPYADYTTEDIVALAEDELRSEVDFNQIAVYDCLDSVHKGIISKIEM